MTNTGSETSTTTRSVRLKITENPLTCFVKVQGTKGRINELLAAISPTSRYCVMRRVDVAELGLATRGFHPLYPGTGSVEIAGSLEGISQHEVITVPRMTLGDLEARGIETMVVEWAMPEAIGIDVILGGTFFAKKKITFDFVSGFVTIADEDPRSRTLRPSDRIRT